jgi:hypothetical protein
MDIVTETYIKSLLNSHDGKTKVTKWIDRISLILRCVSIPLLLCGCEELNLTGLCSYLVGLLLILWAEIKRYQNVVNKRDRMILMLCDKVFETPKVTNV